MLSSWCNYRKIASVFTLTLSLNRLVVKPFPATERCLAPFYSLISPITTQQSRDRDLCSITHIDQRITRSSRLYTTLSNKNIVETSRMTSTFKYPKFERDESLIEKIFDVDVPDPYRYLEEPNSNKTKDFIEEQNKITEPYLEKCPYRSKMREILKADQNYEKIGCPFKRGNKYYFFKNSGLQPQAVLYQQETLDSEPVVFFDPNQLSSDGTVALSLASFSPDGQYFAYGLSYSGSDWVEIKIRNTSTGKDFEEKLTRVKFSSAEWTHDNKGFFYAQYPLNKSNSEGTDTDKNENHCIYYHLIGTEQTEDVLKVNFTEYPITEIRVSQDGKYLHVFPSKGCTNNNWYYCKLDDFSIGDKLVLKTINDQMEAEHEYISNNDEIVYFKTTLDAKNSRVAKLDLKNPSKENWIDVIPNHPQDVLDWAEIYTVNGQDYMLVNFLRKVAHYLELYELEGQVVKKFNMPLGTIAKTGGRRKDGEFFFQFTSFLTPGQTFHFDLNKLDSEPKMLRKSQPKNFNSDDYTIEQVFYKSKDNTEVPMFIIHGKDIPLDGSNPCLLYGYGGFNHLVTSAFSATRLLWLRNFKGVFAVANIRGGGELGRDWHDTGTVLNKQNGFDDFIAAAEYLIKSKYTNTNKIAIQGGSNGGLLVAATSNQRPDLFGATICHVGVLDMIRFASFTIGNAWITDYGDPADKEHFNYLIKYSPYHNIPDQVDHYPATLLLTADHDDRVVPAHSLKFIAQLQYKLGEKVPETPLLIRVDTKAGHGAGRPVSKVIDEYADIHSFLYNALQLQNHFSES